MHYAKRSQNISRHMGEVESKYVVLTFVFLRPCKRNNVIIKDEVLSPAVARPRPCVCDRAAAA